MLLLVDSAGPAAAAALGDLRALAARGTGTDALRRRAAWMLALVSPGTATAGLADEPPPRPLSGWLEAEVAARAGQWSRALEIADKIDVDSAARDADPFIRALARLSRASWLERMGNVAAARRELRWHEHTDVIGALAGSPQAAEIDWAFGTLARWRLARLLDGRHEAGAELCASYGAVVRLWAEGEPQFRARARTARERYAALKCEGAS
jgi:hypothetical protein